MRSKEIDQAIELLEKIKISESMNVYIGVRDVKKAKNLSDYIKELEQDNIELRKYYATRKEVEDLKDTINCLHESSKEYINKDKIRDKIKELKDREQELSDEQGYWGGQDLLDKIEFLEDLLGE